MTALAPTVDAYLAEAIADELALAELLGWSNLVPPAAITPNCWIYGTHRHARGHSARNASAPCPRWRRDWAAAGELIARCQLLISTGPAAVMVAGGGNDFEVYAHYADRPTKDDAIRAAICKAAIAYLKAERAQ